MPDSKNARWDADQQAWVGGTRPRSAGGRLPNQLNIPTLILVPLVVLILGTAVAAAVGIHGEAATKSKVSVEEEAPTENDDFFATPGAPPQDQPTRPGASEPQHGNGTASSAPDDVEGVEEVETESGEGMTDQVVALVNGERESAGCDPLAVDPLLTAAAQEHSEDMELRGYEDIVSPEGEGPGERAGNHGYNMWAAQYVTKGQASADQVADIWMDDPAYRADILNCDLVATGVGKSGDAWTQMFGWE